MHTHTHTHTNFELTRTPTLRVTNSSARPSSFSEHAFPEKSNSLNLYQQKEEVTALARILYKEIKERVSTNVLLKFHNYFFVPMYATINHHPQCIFLSTCEERAC
jgi:hypothetical protein